jgi:hypothetical protein
MYDGFFYGTIYGISMRHCCVAQFNFIPLFNITPEGLFILLSVYPK